MLYLKKTGGHKAACGVSLLVENLVPFWEQVQRDTAALHPDEYIDKSKEYLGKLNLRDVDYQLFKAMEDYQPFGQKFQKPMFIARGKFSKVGKMGKQKNHYTIQIEDGLGCQLRAVWFFFTTDITAGKNYNFIFTINKDDFNNKDPEAIVLHVKAIVPDNEIGII